MSCAKHKKINSIIFDFLCLLYFYNLKKKKNIRGCKDNLFDLIPAVLFHLVNWKRTDNIVIKFLVSGTRKYTALTCQ